MTDAVFDLSSAQRILVVKLDEVGDFVLATPFLRGLRRRASCWRCARRWPTSPKPARMSTRWWRLIRSRPGGSTCAA
ncbi:hypothetical protein [Azospirillum brasilense]|uniref:hypothetical protein n=1 Tax=Azospirillum brasilense TaxID=192 RepID=UPI0003A85D0E|nr:hypothetical protein [Azospirillum brasilense]